MQTIDPSKDERDVLDSRIKQLKGELTTAWGQTKKVTACRGGETFATELRSAFLSKVSQKHFSY